MVSVGGSPCTLRTVRGRTSGAPAAVVPLVVLGVPALGCCSWGEVANPCGLMPHSNMTHLCINNANRMARYENDAYGHIIMN